MSIGMVNQQEYLKKYLKDKKTGKSKEKRKKKKISSKSQGFCVIDDSLDLKDIPFGSEEKDCAPTIAEVTYEDEKIKLIEEFQTNKKKWKGLNSNEANEDQLEIEENKRGFISVEDRINENFQSLCSKSDSVADSTNSTVQRKYSSLGQTEGENKNLSPQREGSLQPNRHDFGKSPLRRKRHDSDTSPRRKRHDSDTSPRRKRKDSNTSTHRMKRHDSETSPSLQKKKSNHRTSPLRQKRLDSDTSPPLQKRQNSDTSPPRRKRHDSDASPLRRERHDSDTSPPRRKRNGFDASPPRRKRHDSDTSPPRRKRNDSNASPPRRKRHDSDTSPPRRKRHDSNASPPRRKRHDSDASPRRKRHDSDTSPPRRKRHDSDASPPRQRRENINVSPLTRRSHDSDASLPRQRRHGLDISSQKNKEISDGSLNLAKRKGSDIKQSSEVSPNPGRKRDSSKSPLRKKSDIGSSLSSFSKQKGNEHFKATSFKKLKNKIPKEQSEEEKALARKLEEKYQKWNKGVVQDQKRKEAFDYNVKEMGKSFARSADDEDMNKTLKNVLRQEDPMLEYIARKEARKNPQPTRPRYQGSFPPNRFNIPPGYRWDGVDRSNGYEKDWFTKQNSKRATEEESYKWSTEDM